jgi:uncharacterized protein involved in exopolysaccharide biosynthesis
MGLFCQPDAQMDGMLYTNTPSHSLSPLPPAPARGGETQFFALRDLLNSLFYHGRAAAIVAAVVAVLGVLAAVLMPPSFSAEARLLPLSTGVYDTREANGPPQPGQVLDPSSVANVELQLLGSLDLHRKLVSEGLGPTPDPALVNKRLADFEKRLHVTKVNDTNVIELTYTDRDPQAAAQVLRNLISGYFEARANALTAGRVAYLAQQRDKVKAQLDTADAALTAFQQQHGIADISAQIAGAVKENDTLRQNEADALASLADSRNTGAAIRGALGKTPAQVELYSDNTEAARALGEMRTQLLALQAKRADVAARFMATAPQVQQLDSQIASLEAALRQQQAALVDTKRMGRNTVYDSTRDRLVQADASASGYAARRMAIAGQLTASQARLRDLNTTAEQLNKMRLDRDVLADSYKSLALQVEQAKVQLNQDAAGNPSVRVIEAPTPPSKRNNPPLLIIVGSVFAALLLAGATVFVLASLRAVFLAPVELERAMGLPVLAAPIAGMSQKLAASGFGRLHAAIDAHADDHAKTILLVTDGSFRALQKAAVGLGRDIHRRKPGTLLLLRFGTDGWDPQDLDNMPVEPFEGIDTATLALSAVGDGQNETRLLERLKERYGYIIIVAPPVRDDVAALRLSQVVDHVAVVVVAERTRRPVLTDMLRDLDQMGAHLLGLVMLSRRTHIPQAVYRLIS